MSHLLDRKDIARIRIQAEFEAIYSKTNKFIQTSTFRENEIEVKLANTNELKDLCDGLRDLCDDCCGKFEENRIDLQSVLYNFDQLEIKEGICVIGNLKKNNSEFYQHLTIKLPHTIVSARLINKMRGVINATIAQINYINAQNNYINAQNNYIITIAQNNNTIAQNNYTIAQNNYIIAQNGYTSTIAQINHTIPENNYTNTIAQNNNTITQNNNAIAQNSNIIAESNNAIARNSNTSAQSSNTIDEVKFSLVLTDTPEDTCTSFVYTLKCSTCVPDKYYVGRTHYGEQECFNKIITNTTSAVYEHIKDTGHTFKIDDMQKVLSCCEDDKLKILESLLIKRHIVGDIGFLNIFVMKKLTLFQYDEQELEKAKRQLTKLTERLGIARKNKIKIKEFSFNEQKYCERNHDNVLTLVQAEFENFYDKTQIFIKDDEDSKVKYIEELTEQCNEIADKHKKPHINWNEDETQILIEDEDSKVKYIKELTKQCNEIADNYEKPHIKWKKDPTRISIENEDSNDKYIRELNSKCNKIADKHNKPRISWNEKETRMFIEYLDAEYIEVLTRKCNKIADDHKKPRISWNEDKTRIFIKYWKDKYIKELTEQCNRIADSRYKQPISWNKVVIGNILECGENSPDGTVEPESKLDNLAIELPDILIREKLKKDIRNLLSSYMEESYRVEESDEPEDTRTSIIYLMKCYNSDCDRKLYIGLTHRGKETRFKEHTETDKASAVYQHIDKKKGHGFNIEDMEILEVCCDHNKLEIFESLYIKEYLLKRNKLLNKKLEEEKLALFAYDKDERPAATKFLNHN